MSGPTDTLDVLVTGAAVPRPANPNRGTHPTGIFCRNLGTTDHYPPVGSP